MNGIKHPHVHSLARSIVSFVKINVDQPPSTEAVITSLLVVQTQTVFEIVTACRIAGRTVPADRMLPPDHPLPADTPLAVDRVLPRDRPHPSDRPQTELALPEDVLESALFLFMLERIGSPAIPIRNGKINTMKLNNRLPSGRCLTSVIEIYPMIQSNGRTYLPNSHSLCWALMSFLTP